MNELRIKSRKDSPEVLFDPDTNVFRIKGICHPENVTKFFQPIMDWLDEYNQFLQQSKSTKDIKVVIFFRYFNSATYKYLISLLQKLHGFTDIGCTLFVEWYYETEDEEMRESGEELFEFSGLEIPHKCIETPYN